jgi:hypothetical protein
VEEMETVEEMKKRTGDRLDGINLEFFFFLEYVAGRFNELKRIWILNIYTIRDYK